MAVLIYGILSYVILLGSLLYAIGFVSDLGVPRSIDVGPQEPLSWALLINCGLLSLFAVSHSVMARQGFKRWWTQIIPPAAERSTYVLTSSLLLALLCWQWRPIPTLVWDIQPSWGRLLLHGLFWAGWALVLISTFLTDHFDLFGLRQVWFHARGWTYTPIGFEMVWLYRYVRHPLLLGFLIAFWASPRMTEGHLLFAVATTVYIIVGIQLEERDLLRAHGEAYQRYREQVSMLLPLPGRNKPAPVPQKQDSVRPKSS
jgi:protein-S-isoprenylcysteine O-methyltransferase Ste14